VINQKGTTEQLQKEINHKSSQCVELKDCLGSCTILCIIILVVRWSASCSIATVEKELQSCKQENESKVTQLNKVVEDLNTALVINNCYMNG